MPLPDDPTTGESADRIARLLLDENRELLQAAKDALKKRLMRAAMQMAMDELGDPETMAAKVYERLGTENESLVQASRVLQDRLLDDIAERTLEPLADPSVAAARAKERIDPSDPRLRTSEAAIKDVLLKQVLTDVLQEIDEEMGFDGESDEPITPKPAAEAPVAQPEPAPELDVIEEEEAPQPRMANIVSLSDASLDDRRT
ncbi:MAG TPA: hypothetical protein VF190_09355, partial [Rhodothermales bacterium]